MRKMSGTLLCTAALTIALLTARSATAENSSSLRDGLSHYWPLDKKDIHDNQFADLAGNVALGKESGAGSGAGLFGEALAGEWLNGGDLPPFGKAALTVSAWIMHDGTAGNHVIVTAGDHTCWTFKIVDNHLAFFALGMPDWQGIKGAATLPTGQWTHVAVVAAGLDEGVAKAGAERRFTLFVNGKEDGGGVIGHSEKKWPDSACSSSPATNAAVRTTLLTAGSTSWRSGSGP